MTGQVAAPDEPWLVALDVDGTLLDYDQELSPAVVEAVRQVMDAGHHVVVATGRSVIATLPITTRLGLTAGWAVCSNGALTLRLDASLVAGYEVVEERTFDPGPAVRLMAARLPDAHFAVEEVGVGFRVNKPFPPGELHGEHTVVGLEELSAAHVTRLVVRSPEHTPEDFHALAAEAGLSDVTYAIGWTAWMDVAPAGVTKAAALEPLRDLLGVANRTLAVGDGFNDLEMLRWASRGVAMAHAPEAVRDAADEVTGTVSEGGVARVLATLPGLDRSTGPVG
ncbi:Cof-type HAD-IIB family hydrolase [Actinotalea sp. M2MS4P-6]|uniref:HAD family hydrolase n=1 Tax=Actinotalea sp. M2MS4P-6 TaxID=2983762 RepID=UPI0021E39F0B|nr:HAD family hydrolase [Actinotalea sp. M2MS4P-6]MCV2395984.1 Cof-type HAD-IIB family hydrolase [Actinotalea sp. M2MS4P-6]